MKLLETANIMFLSFIRFELLSFEHGYPISHKKWNIQEVFHVYLNKFDNAITHLFLVILGNNLYP